MTNSSIDLALEDLLSRIHLSDHSLLESVENELDRVEDRRVLRKSQAHDPSVEEVSLHKVVIVNASVVHDVDCSVSQSFILIFKARMIVSEFLKNHL